MTDPDRGIQWGEIYLMVLAAGEERYLAIRQLQRSEREGYIRLAGNGELHPAEDISLDMIRGLALITTSIRYHTMD